jgi:hypothetical protein
MLGQRAKLRATLRKPGLVLCSRLDESVHLNYRRFRRTPVGPKYLLVAVKMLERDAFIVTAFFTNEAKGGRQIWPT